MSAALTSAEDPARGAERAARRRAEDAIGIAIGIRCAIDPARFASPESVERENDLRQAEALAGAERTEWYVAVSPSYPAHARREISDGRDAVGIELVGPLAAGDPALDVVAAEAERRRLPIRCTSAEVIAALAERRPAVTFILAQMGDGGRWHSALTAAAPLGNVLVDVSGRVAERGMVDAILFEVGPRRVLWGTGPAMETGLAQLRALDVIAPGEEVIQAVRFGNAARIFGFGGGVA